MPIPSLLRIAEAKSNMKSNYSKNTIAVLGVMSHADAVV